MLLPPLKSSSDDNGRSTLEITMICSASLLLILTLCGLASNASFPPSGPDPAIGAVSSLDARCSRIGTDVLLKGGNAADAIIATEFCVGVIGMYLTGIGGGGFAVIRNSRGDYEFIDFRESAPAASNETMFTADPDASSTGGLASGVPGELRGLQYLHRKYGSLPWDNLIEPSIAVARDGFVVGKDLEFGMDYINNDELFLSSPWRPDFAPRGRRVKAGDVMTRKRYANMLQVIRDKGADAFYTGKLAGQVVSAIQSAGGIMTLEDLANYKVKSRPLVKLEFGEYRLVTSGTPSGGIVGLSILNTFKRYQHTEDLSMINLTAHRLVETFRFGYGARTELGDPDFHPEILEYQKRLLSKETAEKIKSRILDDRTQPVEAYNPEGLEILETPGTSHISTADASGMAVSLTSTINLAFGSQVMVPALGVIMNNEMDDFSVPNRSNAFGFISSPSNYIRPGKRPLSSMSPYIVEFSANKSLAMVIGGAGGSRIITATVQGLLNVLNRQMNAVSAVQEPRIHDQLVPNQLLFEYTYDNSTRASLIKKGHKSGWQVHGSDLQVVRLLPNGTFEAAGETRQHESGGFAV
ncbi:gamma-glutamyltransferase 1 [Thelonectria olida]|uniref:Glutathione hydrolase n=1 Tax=Thelonectria olida TaxID=1576542 RepID=A0A9P8VS49_9HYPO|nr:gamma-glutamyltransferase 1 [Thelonectria olida]